MIHQSKTVWLVFVVWAGSLQAYASPFAQGPYLGQAPPGSTAQVFAPGLICRTGYGQWESSGTFSAGGNVFCYKQRLKVYITESTDQGWSVPKHVKSIPINNWPPYLSPDANSIYWVELREHLPESYR